jgi:hypothetical protein
LLIGSRQYQSFEKYNYTIEGNLPSEEFSMDKTLTKVIKNVGGVSIAYW